MKIRTSFVSNSSSSSYILFSSVKNRSSAIGIDHVASYMLDVILKDWERWPDKPSTSRIERAKLLHDNLVSVSNNQDIREGKIGITMPSTNYDTYLLARNDGAIIISTCNNHDWDFESAYDHYSGGGADENDEAHQSIKKAKFYNIENGLIHYYPYYPEDRFKNAANEVFCKKCNKVPFSIAETLDGIMLCSDCYEKLGKSPEKELEELKEERRKSMSAFKHLEP